MASYLMYIIQSLKNQKYYTGSTGNITQRLSEHNRGQNISTRNRGPWKLVYTETFATVIEAKKREQFIKKKE